MTAFAIAIAVVAVAAAIAASLHAILYKRDVRAAIGWTGFIWIAPLAGPLIYLLFGVNRIRRRAAILRGQTKSVRAVSRPERSEDAPLAALVRYGDAVSRNVLHPGNRVEMFIDGGMAYKAMLERIDEARHSISLATYIFGGDAVGRRFIEALARAGSRGVEVRVILDPVGSREHRRHILRALHDGGARAALFLPTFGPRGVLSTNLRNHRKVLVLDGTCAFTGGMNISSEYEAEPDDPDAIRDTQFLLEGPAVADLQQTFCEDWWFVAEERLAGPAWFPPLARQGEAEARVVADGPDEDFERIRWLTLGAIAAARSTIRIATPYFLPDTTLVSALNVAAMRGVRVEILIPERLDHRIVKWASNAQLWQVLEKGCRIWFTDAPFDHSKLFAVDGSWALFGSSNWDPRSFRLNFELNVEVLGATVAADIDRLICERRDNGREITLAMMDARALPIRVRDGIARLFTPYL